MHIEHRRAGCLPDARGGTCHECPGSNRVGDHHRGDRHRRGLDSVLVAVPACEQGNGIRAYRDGRSEGGRQRRCLRRTRPARDHLDQHEHHPLGSGAGEGARTHRQGPHSGRRGGGVLRSRRVRPGGGGSGCPHARGGARCARTRCASSWKADWSTRSGRSPPSTPSRSSTSIAASTSAGSSRCSTRRWRAAASSWRPRPSPPSTRPIGTISTRAMRSMPRVSPS